MLKLLEQIKISTENFDFKGKNWVIGRTVFGLAYLVILVFTPIKYLVPAVGYSGAGPKCESYRRVSLLCTGIVNNQNYVYATILMVVFTLLFISGIFPRYTTLLMFYVVFSLSLSITLPDGGDSIGLSLAFL